MRVVPLAPVLPPHLRPPRAAPQNRRSLPTLAASGTATPPSAEPCAKPGQAANWASKASPMRELALALTRRWRWRRQRSRLTNRQTGDGTSAPPPPRFLTFPPLDFLLLYFQERHVAGKPVRSGWIRGRRRYRFDYSPRDFPHKRSFFFLKQEDEDEEGVIPQGAGGGR